MTITVDLDKDKRPLGELVEQTLEGAEVVFTKGDRPVAKLVPIHLETAAPSVRKREGAHRDGRRFRRASG